MRAPSMKEADDLFIDRVVERLPDDERVWVVGWMTSEQDGEGGTYGEGMHGTYGEYVIVEALTEAVAEAEREPQTDVAASFWDRLTDGKPVPWAQREGS